MNMFSLKATFSCALFAATTSFAQVTLAPLTSFGGGDGWLAPGENTLLTSTGDNVRGLGYNATNNHLYFVNRGATITIPILNATSGAQTGTLDASGISIGTFILNKIAVGDDGVIYGTNLRTGTTAQTYRIYRWADEIAAPPTLIFDVIPDATARVGDDLDIIGGGAGTRLLAGYGVAAGAPNSNGYLVVNPTLSAPTPTTPSFNNVTFAEGAGGTNDGDFRLGVTYLQGGISGGTVLGTQGTSTTASRLTSYLDGTGSTPGTLLGSVALQTISERAYDFATVGGVPLLATVELGGTAAAPLATSGTVRLYDMTNPAVPAFLASGITMTGTPNINANSAGDVRWGQITGNTATLYVLSTNNGIEAFTVTVPEPSTALLFGIGAIGFVFRRPR